LYGLHSVEAALLNQRRQILKVLATENAARRLEAPLRARGFTAEIADPRQLDRLVGADAVHQGVVLEARHLSPLGIEDVKPEGILVGNLAQALSALGELGILRVGLAEQGAEALETAALTLPLALVLGAEGTGLRQLTRERCDRLCRISTQGEFASLNVSNAAAIALHWTSVTARALTAKG
jgi:23S rRNA (guanosine2251-2'-O)-methyltransferase